ncbi:hypothetical protein TIFTF001_041311 [Ficus carica]|uniref:Uncharacterized protein n=1 Tax=Ficus carica TaxID=3494 RepID=A0AA87ZML6_FICCA|nr:hypothetical protein TIFTF001_041305 [Ficus carica]GMN29397.1 hypothetical protein TIFTF001_041307 [Ficus carica]GMN29407.1 hypothetical protein TIFTF001_041309 [Ficus carica]GMN29428.1 hypothetical protein TIFTF001_041311 [Ficus carica]
MKFLSPARKNGAQIDSSGGGTDRRTNGLRRVSVPDIDVLWIIFKETLEREMLELPQKFVRLYGESLSNSVVLKPPFGSTWKIGLEKRDGKCDITTWKISSPSISAHLDERDVNKFKKEETEGDRDAVQFFDSSSSREENLPPSSPHHKRVRASASGQGSQTPTEEDKTLGSDSSNNDFGIHPLGQAEETRSQNPQVKFGKFKSGDHRAIGRLTPLRFRESKAYEAANKFFSKNPFCITIVTSTYVVRKISGFEPIIGGERFPLVVLRDTCKNASYDPDLTVTGVNLNLRSGLDGYGEYPL